MSFLENPVRLRFVHRPLFRARNFSEPQAIGEQTFVFQEPVGDEEGTRIFFERIPHAIQDPRKDRLRERIEQIEHGGFGWELKVACVLADQFDLASLLPFARVAGNIFLGDAVEAGQVFDSQNTTERIVGGHHEAAALT